MKIGGGLRIKYPWVFIITLIVFYFIIILKLVAKPLIGWEVLSWEQAMHVYKQGANAVNLFNHPTFYAYLGALNFKLFGPSEISFRITTIFCFIGTLFLLPVLVRLLLRQENYAFPATVSVLLFALSPLSVQGSLIHDSTDTGLLVLATVVFFVAYYAFYNASMVKKIIILGVVYGFCLCTKITTNLALPLSIFVFLCFKKKWQEAGVLSLGIFAVGVSVFSLCWFLNCFFTHQLAEFFTPFVYVINNFMNLIPHTNQTISNPLLTRMLTIFRMGMWMTPFFVVLVAVAFFFQAKQFFAQKILNEENYLLVYSLIVFLVYVLADAVIQGGFPKYIAPIIPALCVYMGITLYRYADKMTVSPFWGFVFVCGFLYYYFIVGDALYPTFLIRKYSYTGDKEIFPLIVSFALKGLLFPVVVAAGVLILKKYSVRMLILILFISLLANNTATLVAQSRADYATGEAYGNEGAEAVKEFCIENKKIYVCQEGMVATGDNDVEFRILPANLWKDTASFYVFLKRERPQFLVYGFACNTIAQMRLMETPQINEYLNRNYQRSIAGSYVLCSRFAVHSP